MSSEGANAYRIIVEDALSTTSIIKVGPWKTLGECEFWISGNNVSIVKDGVWITTFPLINPNTVECITGLPEA